MERTPRSAHQARRRTPGVRIAHQPLPPNLQGTILLEHPEGDARDADRLCNIDYEREIVLVAETREGGKRRLIGIGTLNIDPDFGNGEFSVVVHDDYQGKGLGYKLIDTLIGIAQEKGLRNFSGSSSPTTKR